MWKVNSQPVLLALAFVGGGLVTAAFLTAAGRSSLDLASLNATSVATLFTSVGLWYTWHVQNRANRRAEQMRCEQAMFVAAAMWQEVQLLRDHLKSCVVDSRAARRGHIIPLPPSARRSNAECLKALHAALPRVKTASVASLRDQISCFSAVDRAAVFVFEGYLRDVAHDDMKITTAVLNNNLACAEHIASLYARVRDAREVGKILCKRLRPYFSHEIAELQTLNVTRLRKA